MTRIIFFHAGSFAQLFDSQVAPLANTTIQDSKCQITQVRNEYFITPASLAIIRTHRQDPRKSQIRVE